MHRDLKPENLMLATKGPNSDIKIIDFGLSKLMRSSDEEDQQFVGTKVSESLNGSTVPYTMSQTDDVQEADLLSSMGFFFLSCSSTDKSFAFSIQKTETSLSCKAELPPQDFRHPGLHSWPLELSSKQWVS
jgi:serine/threonine protein kinase